MILFELNNLNRETNEAIKDNIEKMWRWEITEEEWSDRHDAIMDNFRLRTQIILSKIPTWYES